MSKTMMALCGAGLFILGGVAGHLATHFLFKHKDPRDAMQTVDALQDWRLTCPPRTDKSGNIDKTGSCIIQETLVQRGSGSVIAELDVSRKNGADNLTIVTPLGVLIAPGLKFMVGAKMSKSVPFVTCVQVGCVAQLPIDAGLATALSQNKGGHILVANGAGKTVALTYSLLGYQDALDARAEDMAARNGNGG